MQLNWQFILINSVRFCRFGHAILWLKEIGAFFVVVKNEKFCMRGHLADVINRAKFYLNQIRGFDSVEGRIFGFPTRKRSRR